MLGIFVIVLVICLLAIKLGKSSKSEITDEIVQRIAQSEARAAVARCQMLEERDLKLAEQKLIKEAIRQRKRVPKPAGSAESVIPKPVPVKVPELSSGGSDWDYGEDDDLSSPETDFSPEEWWDDNYKNVVQESSDSFRIDSAFLPVNKKRWAEIGVYLVDNESFTDFSIWENFIVLKMN